MAIYYTAGDTGSNWNGGTIFNGSSSQNGYGFYIGVRETYVGSSSENISNIAIQIGIKNNGVRFNTNGWCFKYTVDGVVCDYATGVNIGTNYSGYYDDVRPITLDGSNNRGMYVNSIPHNDNGTKTVHIKVEMYNSTYGAYTPGYCVVEGDLTLTTIPRGTTITYFNAIPQDETSVKFYYETEHPCDYAWYSKDGGSNWYDLPSSNIIGGLSPDTPYTFQLLVRRTDTQIQTSSGFVQARTYDYPKVTLTGDFTIGNNCTVNVYNPLGRNIVLDLISNNDGSVIGSYTGTWNGVLTGFADATSINNQYASIPDKMASTYYARVTYGSIVKTYGNGVYSITGDVKPVITIDAEDTNKTLATGNRTCNLTGSNKTFIKFMSNANVTLEAIAQKGSKIKSTYIRYSGDTRSTSIIDTTRIQTETFTNVENVTFTGNATDTREQSLQTPVSATGLTLVPYIKLTLENVLLYRQSQTSDTLYCSGDGDYFNDTFGSVANTITFKYRYKESSVSSWEGISWNTQSVTVGSGNEYSFDFQVGTTFDYTKTYNFQFEVSDACMVVTDSQDAKPGIPVQGLFENFHEAFGVKTFERDNSGNVSLGDNVRTEHYSTTEQVVGKWTDGKPIYRKVLTGTMSTSTTYTNITIDEYFENVVNVYGFIKKDSNFYPISYYNYVTYYIYDSNKLRIGASGSSYKGDYTITVEYTKTTD